MATISAGVLKKCVVGVPGKEPFGFIAPEGGGNDVYFNARSLGGGKTWDEFFAIVKRSEPGGSHVTFVLDTSRGKPQANAVVALDPATFEQLDADGDGAVTAEEIAQFLSTHPEHLAASKTQQETRQAAREAQKAESKAESERRGELFARQNAKEDGIWSQITERRERSKALHEAANELWESGDKEGSKQKRREMSALKEEMNALRHDVEALDEANNEEMFAYVQENEHDGRPIDGTWIDLHGLSGDFALRKCEEFLLAGKTNGVKEVEVITGAGNHSGKKGPVVKCLVWTDEQSLLNKAKDGNEAGLEGLTYEEESAGSIKVLFSS